jgi:hypothetical protein
VGRTVGQTDGRTVGQTDGRTFDGRKKLAPPILKPKIKVEHTKQLEKEKRKLFHPHPKKEKANFIVGFKLL